MYIISIPKVFKPTNQRNCYFLKFLGIITIYSPILSFSLLLLEIKLYKCKTKKYYEKENKTNATSKKMCLVNKNDTLH